MPKVFVGTPDNWASDDDAFIEELAYIIATASSTPLSVTYPESVKIHTDKLVWPVENTIDVVILELEREGVDAKTISAEIADGIAKSYFIPSHIGGGLTVKVAVAFTEFGLATKHLTLGQNPTGPQAD
jgi:hypothetical protein